MYLHRLQHVLPGMRMIKHTIVAGPKSRFQFGTSKTLPALVLSMTVLPISGYRSASISVVFLLCCFSSVKTEEIPALASHQGLQTTSWCTSWWPSPFCRGKMQVKI